MLSRAEIKNVKQPSKETTLLLHLARSEIHIQYRLSPEAKQQLVFGPVLTLWRELHVEVEDDTGKYKA